MHVLPLAACLEVLYNTGVRHLRLTVLFLFFMTIQEIYNTPERVAYDKAWDDANAAAERGERFSLDIVADAAEKVVALLSANNLNINDLIEFQYGLQLSQTGN